MALQYGVALRNAQLDQIQSQGGASANLIIYTGSPPADCATGDSGSVLATIVLPATFMAGASGGAAAKTGTWSVAASGTGTAGYFRIKNGSAVVIAQGTVGQGSGDLSLDNTSIVAGQTVTVNTFQITAANA